MDDGRVEHVAELADKYGRLVFTTAYRILGRPQDAEDALQEVFLRLLDAWGKGLSPEVADDWGAYLRTMASHAALDLLRKRKRRSGRETPLVGDVATPAALKGIETLAAQEQADRLRAVLAGLPERDAQVFSLRYFEDFSYEAIATYTGLSVNLVGVILCRSRKCLRDLLRQAEVED
jgi:RNA polymerase sigma-70 factor (ECF subfamily)